MLLQYMHVCHDAWLEQLTSTVSQINKAPGENLSQSDSKHCIFYFCLPRIGLQACSGYINNAILCPRHHDVVHINKEVL
jgi:hypothetical protein